MSRPLTSLPLVLVVLLALIVGACGGAPQGLDSASRTQSSAESVSPAATGRAGGASSAAPPVAGAPVPGAPAASAPANRQAGGAGQATKPAEAASAADSAAPAEPVPAPALLADQKIIRTGRIDMVVADVSEALRTITRIITGTGGFVQQSATREEGNAAIAEMTLRVPVDRYDGVFQQLRDLAVPEKKPIESSEAQDVTEEFADVQARMTNLKATEAQLLRLLARAEKMEDVLIVQRELTNVREQIERLQGRLNVIERRAAFSTITVTLRPRPEARRPNPPVLQQPGNAQTGVTVRPTFSWATSEGATGYTLQVTTEVDTTFASPLLSVERLNSTQLEWPSDDLRLGSVYRWRVRASNAAGDGEWSPNRLFTTVAGWDPLRTVNQSWAASLRFLQGAVDVTLRVVVFLWWLFPLIGLVAFWLRTTIRRSAQRRASLAAVATPPAAPPAPPSTNA